MTHQTCDSPVESHKVLTLNLLIRSQWSTCSHSSTVFIVSILSIDNGKNVYCVHPVSSQLHLIAPKMGKATCAYAMDSKYE